MAAVYDTLDGSRPSSRPDLATDNETMILQDPKPRKQKGYDFGSFGFIEKRKQGFVPVVFGRGRLYSMGAVKWQGKNGGKFRTKGVNYNKFLLEPPARNATPFSMDTSQGFEDQKI